MWYRYIKLAEQGVFNPIGPGGIDLNALIESFFNQSLTTDSKGLKTLDFDKLNSSYEAEEEKKKIEPLKKGK